MRSLFVGAALLVFAFSALADGEYQRTRDGKTMVWNDDPKAGDEAAWSGERDGEGYAAGFGTLIWYTGEKQTVKRLGILPTTKSRVYARYFGNMVHGKFNGPVNAHANGKTTHAVFTDGTKTGRWIAGPARTRNISQPRVEVAKQETPEKPASVQGSGVTEAAPVKTSEVEASAKSSSATEPIPPAAGPVQKVEVKSKKAEVKAPASQLPTPDIPIASAEVERTSDVKPATSKKSPSEVEQSLYSLVGPPASLHTNVTADGSSTGASQDEPRLTRDVVIDLADAEARGRGYSPTEYGRGDPEYKSADRVWSVNYKPLDNDTIEFRKPFSITIDDKTKGTIFVLSK